jgi:hypothetical protein
LHLVWKEAYKSTVIKPLGMDFLQQAKTRWSRDEIVAACPSASGGRLGVASVRRRGRRSIGVLLLIALSAHVLQVRGQSGERPDSAPSPVEQFKEFIANPPRIENLVFSVEVLPSSGSAEPGIKRAGTTTFFQAKWQPGSVFFREIQGPEVAASPATPGQLVVIDGPEYWFRQEGRSNIDKWTDGGPSAIDHDNFVVRATGFRLSPLWEIMNFGVLHLGPAKICWSGDCFRVETVSDRENYTISGKLISNESNGLPDRLELAYLRKGKTYNWIARYGYGGTTLDVPMPAFITNSWQNGSREIPRYIYRLLKIKTVGGSLSHAAFDPRPLAATNQWSPQIYTNYNLYAVLPSGESRFIESLWRQEHGLPADGSHDSPVKRRFCYAALAAMNFGFLILAAKISRSERATVVTRTNESTNSNEKKTKPS